MNTSEPGHGQIDSAQFTVLIYVSGPGRLPLSPLFALQGDGGAAAGCWLLAAAAAAAAAGPNAELIGFLSPVGGGTRHHRGHQGRVSALCSQPDC